ncbi:MAG TPA: DUF1385 domain-containing protein [Polyangiaceae bacterium]|nr:DUF1385 domain-containing protein [Polyangiaceae bacterium]
MPSPPARPYIGGQAVLEGVMMRAPKSFAVVVRRRDKSLHVRERPMLDGARGASRWPFVRGVASLAESLRLGSEALRFSGDLYEKDLENAPATIERGAAGLGVLGALGLAVFVLAAGDGDGSVSAGETSPRSGGGGRSWVILATAVAFFVALPQLAAAGINRGLGLGLEVQGAAFQAITGVLKLAIIVGYMLAMRRIPEMRRVFQYHGAEHKTISTYEAGEPLTVAHARAKTTLHPRCGTTFLVMVALVSVMVFVLVGATLPRIHTGSAVADNVLFFLAKLPFLPILVGVTFELQRVLARYCSTGPLRTLLWPGFLVQRVTTAPPDDDQLEVALASLRVTLFRQEQGHAYATQEDVLFRSYEDLLAAQALRPAA